VNMFDDFKPSFVFSDMSGDDAKMEDDTALNCAVGHYCRGLSVPCIVKTRSFPEGMRDCYFLDVAASNPLGAELYLYLGDSALVSDMVLCSAQLHLGWWCMHVGKHDLVALRRDFEWLITAPSFVKDFPPKSEPGEYLVADKKHWYDMVGFRTLRLSEVSSVIGVPRGLLLDGLRGYLGWAKDRGWWVPVGEVLRAKFDIGTQELISAPGLEKWAMGRWGIAQMLYGRVSALRALCWCGSRRLAKDEVDVVRHMRGPSLFTDLSILREAVGEPCGLSDCMFPIPLNRLYAVLDDTLYVMVAWYCHLAEKLLLARKHEWEIMSLLFRLTAIGTMEEKLKYMSGMLYGVLNVGSAHRKQVRVPEYKTRDLLKNWLVVAEATGYSASPSGKKYYSSVKAKSAKLGHGGVT